MGLEKKPTKRLPPRPIIGFSNRKYTFITNYTVQWATLP
jgi:hypothetical protein